MPARNGWAFVVLDDDNVLVAAAAGAPPPWVDDIPGTEAWALAQAGLYALPGSTFFVGCLPSVDAFHAGPVACSADNKPLARVHAFMHHALDDVPKDSVIWTPAHPWPGACGTAVRGDGFLVQEVDVGANGEADRYAKLAVLEHRLPEAIRRQLKEHDSLVASNAKCALPERRA